MGKNVYVIDYFERKKTFRQITIQARKRLLKKIIEELQENGHIVTKVEERQKERLTVDKQRRE